MSASVFCVVNPDVRLVSPVLVRLCDQLMDGGVGLVAPVVKNSHLATEDSARRLPTPFGILKKALCGSRTVEYDASSTKIVYPDWIAGMFMAIRWDVYSQNGGFNEAYFLYYEDVDLCCRLRLAGNRFGIDGGIYIIHEARRTSHVKLKYLRWHMTSMLRFFLSRTFLRCYWKIRSDRK